MVPTWTPDGRAVTWRSGPAGQGRARMQAADGSGQPELVFEDFDLGKAVWSPDGEWLVIRRAGIVGSESARDIHGSRPGVDSAAIALVAKPPVPGAGSRHLPRWPLAGLFFFDLSSHAISAMSFTVDTARFRPGTTRTVVEVPPGIYVSTAGNQDFWDVAPGGDRFLMARMTPGEGTRGLILVQNFESELRRIAPR